MEKQIPTVEIEIEGEKVLLYQWLTQEEEDKLNAIMIGDMEIDPTKLKGKEVDYKVKVSMEKISLSNKHLIESICQSHKWETINSWKPSKRAKLLDQVNEIRSKN